MRGGWSSPTPYTPMDGENKAITTKKKKKKKRCQSFFVRLTWTPPDKNFWICAWTMHQQRICPACAWLQMTGAHNFFRLYAPVICEHPQLRGMLRTLTLCLQFPIVTTILWGQLAGKTMTVLPRSLFLYCTAMFV